MIKGLVTLRFSLKRMIILLIIAGLAYLGYPRVISLAGLWLHPLLASTATTAVSQADTLPAFAAPAPVARIPASKDSNLVAAQAASPTATATATSTSTPTPPLEETPIPRPTLVNQATADYLNALATADAAINSTAIPTPPTSGTATPLLPESASTFTPSPTSIALVVVTETPTPRNIITVAAIAARATAIATAVGTYTPVPWNWVVPTVIIPDPPTATPANAATASFQAAEATAWIFVNGTPTPAPVNVWTATPTPYMVPVIGEVATPWFTPTPTPMHPTIPQELVGKILFLSNRSGGPQPLAEPLVYAIDPDGSNLAVMTDDTFYRAALARDTYSADQRYRTFTNVIRRYHGTLGEYDLVTAIMVHDYEYSVVDQISFFGAGEAWDPVWSPTREQVAFISNESEHAEVWIVNRDLSGLRWLTQTDSNVFASEIGKNTFTGDDENGHPSYSPDGSKIVFWSSRAGYRQILVMDAVDGSNVYSLSTTHYDDWDPVWVKYTDPVFRLDPNPGNQIPDPGISAQSTTP